MNQSDKGQANERRQKREGQRGRQGNKSEEGKEKGGEMTSDILRYCLLCEAESCSLSH